MNQVLAVEPDIGSSKYHDPHTVEGKADAVKKTLDKMGLGDFAKDVR